MLASLLQLFLELQETNHNKIAHRIDETSSIADRNAVTQSRRRLERGKGRRDDDREVGDEAVGEEAVGEEPESVKASRLADRFHRSTRKLSSSGQTSSSPDGLAGDVEVTGGGNTGWRRESAWSGRLRLEGVD